MWESIPKPRAIARAAVTLAGACALCACATFTEPHIGTQTRAVSAVDRDMALLAFLAYVGDSLDGSDREVERKLQSCMPRELARQPGLLDRRSKPRWTLDWGPVVYKFHSALLDDNMMYAVRNRHDPRRVAVVVRGTNPDSISDWLREDLDVGHTVAWAHGTAPAGLQPRISRATHTGLKALQGLAPAHRMRHAGQTIDAYLHAVVYDEERPVTSIAVVGHSLGGALAPTLALWLADTRSKWDRDSLSTLSVHALAGPTPGDADFAAYYDSRLPDADTAAMNDSRPGDRTRRFHNPYDVAPLAWNVPALRTVPNRYRPDIDASLPIEAAATLVIDLVRDRDYAQIVHGTPRVRGGITPGTGDFLLQAAWQHHFGYVCGMGLDLIPVSSNCRTDPPIKPLACPPLH